MDEETIQPEMLQSTGSLLNDLLFSELPPTSAETSLEVNLGVIKMKRFVKNEHKDAINHASIMQHEISELKQIIEKMSEQLKKLTSF